MKFPNPLKLLIKTQTPSPDHIPNYLTEEEPIYRWTVGQVIEAGTNPQAREAAWDSYQPKSYEEALSHPMTVELSDMATRCSWDDEFMMTCHEFALELYDTLWPLVQGKKTARQILRSLDRKKKSPTAQTASAMYQPDQQNNENDAQVMSFWIYELMEYGDDWAEELDPMPNQVNSYLRRMMESPTKETTEILQIIHKAAQEHDKHITNDCLTFSQYCWGQNTLYIPEFQSSHP